MVPTENKTPQEKRAESHAEYSQKIQLIVWWVWFRAEHGLIRVMFGKGREDEARLWRIVSENMNDLHLRRSESGGGHGAIDLGVPGVAP